MTVETVSKRKAGLTVIKGYFATVLDFLRIVGPGITREEAIKKFIEMSPDLQRSSAQTYLRVIAKELNLLSEENKSFTLNDMGRELLVTRNPTSMQKHLLTNILGFDILLHVLDRMGSLSRKQLIPYLQAVHPGWTTDFMPGSLLNWSASFELVERKDKMYSLSQRGREWVEWLRGRDVELEDKVDAVVLSTFAEDDIEPDAARVARQESAPASQLNFGFEELIAGKQFSDSSRTPKQASPYEWPAGELIKTSLHDILQHFEKLPYHFEEELIKEFYVALHAHPHKRFVLLSGLSGTGKSALAQEFANAYHRVATGKKNKYFHLASIQPDWMDATPLLGYVNPLSREMSYMSPPCLEFLLSALRNPEKGHFLCLDEMNLARPEYYFAPFLSAMESKTGLHVHQANESLVSVPASLPWPSNLFIIGTVNMDETTHSFSDKLLDRAMTFEFWDVNLQEYKDRIQNAPSPEWQELDVQVMEKVIDTLQDVMEPLKRIRQHFGYRTVSEILRYVHTYCAEIGNEETVFQKAIDRAISMKVLPKLRGENDQEIVDAFDQVATVLDERNCTNSAQRVKQMKQQLLKNGTARFLRA